MGMLQSPHPVTSTAEDVLEQLASRLDISDTHYEAAKRSYESVGSWLNRAESSIVAYKPTIYSQGSFRLGTVIRPPSDEDFFDLDIVCEINRLKTDTTQKELKEAIGAELAAYTKRHNMESPEPGQYCWTMLYADSAQFQMDVLPAIPDASTQRLLLEARQLDVTWVKTAIGITNTKHPQYEQVTREWTTSNPRGYAAWFRSRMEQIFMAKRRSLALSENQADVERIPEHRVKTPLQSAIQILKRHRNGAFADRPNIRPASIILTTLSAHSYSQEETIAGALFRILRCMDSFIEDRIGIPWIPNPSDARENFANRWENEPEMKDAFYEWLNSARNDFEAASQLSERAAITEGLAKHMGRGLMEKVSSDEKKPSSRARITTALARILAAPHKQAPSWPTLRAASVRLSATASRRGFRPAQIANNGPALYKHCDLQFEAQTDARRPYDVYWQVVNTGDQAREAQGLRGTFESARTEIGRLKKEETTLYSGTHSLECFIVKDGYCVAQSGPFIVNIR
jgi:hypothetical protein